MTHDDKVAWLKLLGVWAAAVASSITLQHLLMFVTLVYTLLQVYILVRDKIIKKREQKENQESPEHRD
ncbi:MAG: hypothetical protein ACK5OQ_16295 [Burkholderiales bacterium]